MYRSIGNLTSWQRKHVTDNFTQNFINAFVLAPQQKQFFLAEAHLTCLFSLCPSFRSCFYFRKGVKQEKKGAWWLFLEDFWRTYEIRNLQYITEYCFFHCLFSSKNITYCRGICSFRNNHYCFPTYLFINHKRQSKPCFEMKWSVILTLLRTINVSARELLMFPLSRVTSQIHL